MAYEMRGRDIMAAIHAARPGLPVTIEHTGGGCATMYIGAPYTDAAGDTRYPLVLGPGWFVDDGARFPDNDTYIGPDDDGATTPAEVHGIADVLAAIEDMTARCAWCGTPEDDHLTADECQSHGIDTRDGRGCAVVTRAEGPAAYDHDDCDHGCVIGSAECPKWPAEGADVDALAVATHAGIAGGWTPDPLPVRCEHCGGSFLPADLATLRANGYHLA